MSFSDFGRSAMTAHSTTEAVASPSGVSKSRNVRRSSDPMPPRLTVDGRRRTKSSRETGVPKPSTLGSQSSRRRRSDGGAVAGDRTNSTKSLEIYRGVRPKLDHIQCPVTKKTLMDDVLTVQGDEGTIDASLASTSISSSTTNHDKRYDDDSVNQYSDSDIGLNHACSSREEVIRRKHRSSRNRSSTSNRSASYVDGRKGARQEMEGSSHLPDSSKRRQRRMPKHYTSISETTDQTTNEHIHKRRDSKVKVPDKKQSRNTSRRRNQASGSGKLSTEIAQFQKMVADLAALSGSSASSPEAMWKSRILLRSANEAGKDLKVSLEKEEIDVAARKNSAATAALAASRKKMLRDFHRASEQLRLIVEETERRQKAEISCLTATEAAEAGTNPVASQKRALMGAAEAEEDFFDRAMRERQAEVQKISDGMKKVQDIYTDLAGLVDGQQEQIDKLEDINEEIKADTRAGLEEIQHGMWKLCMAEQYENNGIGAKDPSDRTTNRNRKKKVLDPSDILNCMMACNGNPESRDKGDRGVLSLDDVLLHERSTNNMTAPQHLKDSNANYYRDDVEAIESGWNLPNLEDVQESAQDAYQKGHAIVGDLVGHVHEVVASGEYRDVGNRFSCTPQPDEISLGENNGAFGGVEFEEGEYSSVKHSREYELGDESHRHHSEGRRSRSRQSPHSHSKRKHKHKNRYHQDDPGQLREDGNRQYDKALIKKDHHRRRSRHGSFR